MPSGEELRLAALHALALLDSEPEREFDALVALAADMLGCPTAMLSLIDRNRLWVKAGVGIGVSEIRRDLAVCDHTIRGSDPLVIEDLAVDSRFADNPLITDNGLRFYAGMPIHVLDRAGDRQAIGALCVVDGAPRSLSPAGHAALAHLATIAEALIHARRTAHDALGLAIASEAMSARLARQDGVFRQAEQMARIGSWRLSLTDQAVEWSDNVFRIHGLPVGQMPALDAALTFYPPDARARVAAALDKTIATGEPFDIEEDFVALTGERRRVRSRGEIERTKGVATGIVGVFQDVTDYHRLATALRRSADTDALTGIANRAAFDRRLAAAMTAARANGTSLSLALIDLDGFKAINDTLGHTAGDDVLKGVARALSAPWLDGAFAARLGGDEFAVILESPTLCTQRDLAERLEDALRRPVEAGGVRMTSAGTVGIAAFDGECRSIRDFVHRADTLLYAGKRARVADGRLPERRQAA